jgi:hypothetical protein
MLAIAALRWQRSTSLEAAPGAVAIARVHPRPVADSLLVAAEEMAVANDPFRLSNTPPEIRFDPRDESANSARLVPFTPVRPSFALKGITGGPPWQAVIDGVPGQSPGVVVREGERFDRLVVRAVTRDSVIIQGPDTAWVLRFGSRP